MPPGQLDPSCVRRPAGRPVVTSVAPARSSAAFTSRSPGTSPVAVRSPIPTVSPRRNSKRAWSWKPAAIRSLHFSGSTVVRSVLSTHLCGAGWGHTDNHSLPDGTVKEHGLSMHESAEYCRRFQVCGSAVGPVERSGTLDGEVVGPGDATVRCDGQPCGAGVIGGEFDRHRLIPWSTDE